MNHNQFTTLPVNMTTEEWLNLVITKSLTSTSNWRLFKNTAGGPGGYKICVSSYLNDKKNKECQNTIICHLPGFSICILDIQGERRIFNLELGGQDLNQTQILLFHSIQHIKNRLYTKFY